MEIKIAKHFKTMVDKLFLQSSNRFDIKKVAKQQHNLIV